MEAGVVVGVEDFTGPAAGSPWWLPTKAVLVEGASGVGWRQGLPADEQVAQRLEQRRSQFHHLMEERRGEEGGGYAVPGYEFIEPAQIRGPLAVHGH